MIFGLNGLVSETRVCVLSNTQYLDRMWKFVHKIDHKLVLLGIKVIIKTSFWRQNLAKPQILLYLNNVWL